MKKKTRKAYIVGKDGEKHWFDIDRETAEKVLRLQKMFAKDEKNKTWYRNLRHQDETVNLKS